MTRRTFDDKIKKKLDMSLETKKTLIIRLYQVLYEYSDAEHPLTQSEIIDLLDKNYGVEAERKAIGRNVSCLMEMGVDIVMLSCRKTFRKFGATYSHRQRAVQPSYQCGALAGTH